MRAFLLLCLWFFLTPAARADEVADRVARSRTLTVALVPGRPPHSFWNDDRQIAGFDVDLARAVAKEMGVIPRFVHPRWEEIVAGAWNGKWDVAITSMTPEKSRLEHLEFPVIYAYLPVAAAVNRANSRYQSVYDLDGRTVGVCGNCSFEKYLRRTLQIDHSVAPIFSYKLFPGKIVTFEDDDDAFRDLEAGDGERLDAVVSSRISIEHHIARGKPVRMLDNVLYYEPLAIAVEKDHTAFAHKIADAVAKLNASGALKQISLKWFDADYTKPGR